MLQNILNLNETSIPIYVYVDNKSVVEAIHSTKAVDNKLLRIDIGSIKQLVNTNKIASISWCPGSIQLANPLTKKGAQSSLLRTIILTGKMKLDEWKLPI